jgi:hypothetical protein
MTAALSRFLKTPTATRLLAESEAIDLEARRKLAADLPRLRARLESEVPPLVKAIAPLEAKVIAARQSLLEAEAAHRAAVHASSARRTSLEGMIAALEGQLRAAASPAIDLFRGELLELHNSLRNAPPFSRIVATRRNILDNGKTGTLQSDTASTARRLAAIVRLLGSLDELKLAVLSEEDLAARLAELRRSIPDSELEEVDIMLPA